MNNQLNEIVTQSKKRHKENLLLVRKLKKNKPKKLDDIVHKLHAETFSNIDCLQCANCCKTTSPIFYDRDIERIAKHLKLKPASFINEYLKVDEEGDYVLKSAPCPFLDYENYCTVYEHRPAACKEYPHTNRKRFYQILDLSLKNTEICPAVATIFNQLPQYFSHA